MRKERNRNKAVLVALTIAIAIGVAAVAQSAIKSISLHSATSFPVDI